MPLLFTELAALCVATTAVVGLPLGRAVQLGVIGAREPAIRVLPRSPWWYLGCTLWRRLRWWLALWLLTYTLLLIALIEYGQFTAHLYVHSMDWNEFRHPFSWELFFEFHSLLGCSLLAAVVGVLLAAPWCRSLAGIAWVIFATGVGLPLGIWGFSRPLSDWVRAFLHHNTYLLHSWYTAVDAFVESVLFAFTCGLVLLAFTTLSVWWRGDRWFRFGE
jgi:hypothetical protein